MVIFSITDELGKAKVKMLSLASISLFIALTETLPKQIAFLGLNFTGKEDVLGWFIFTLTVYFALRFFLLSLIEVVKYYLPSLISISTSKSTGDIIGLTIEECFQHQASQDTQDYDIGTISAEISEVERKNELISYQYKKWFVKFSNVFNLIFEIILPSFFSIISSTLLYLFLT